MLIKDEKGPWLIPIMCKHILREHASGLVVLADPTLSQDFEACLCSLITLADPSLYQACSCKLAVLADPSFLKIFTWHPC